MGMVGNLIGQGHGGQIQVSFGSNQFRNTRGVHPLQQNQNQSTHNNQPSYQHLRNIPTQNHNRNHNHRHNHPHNNNHNNPHNHNHQHNNNNNNNRNQNYPHPQSQQFQHEPRISYSEMRNLNLSLNSLNLPEDNITNQ